MIWVNQVELLTNNVSGSWKSAEFGQIDQILLDFGEGSVQVWIHQTSYRNNWMISKFPERPSDSENFIKIVINVFSRNQSAQGPFEAKV